jgi:hypothetical protein
MSIHLLNPHLPGMRVRFRGATYFKTPLELEHDMSERFDSRVPEASDGLYAHWFAENIDLLELC